MPRDISALQAALPGIAFQARKDGDEVRRLDATDVKPEDEDKQWVDPSTLPGWDQAAYDAAVAAVQADAEVPVLSPTQFEYMLAVTGLEDVWEAVEADAKGSDRKLYAKLRAQRKEASFRLSKTLEFKNDPAVKAIIARVARTADLSDARITEAWHEAAEQNFETLRTGATP